MIAVLATLLSLGSGPQDPPALAVTLHEEAQSGRKPPVFTCKATSALPEGTVFNVQLLLETPSGRQPVDRTLGRLRDGRFAVVFEPFRGRERNLPGVWIARVTYDPLLQIGDPPLPKEYSSEGLMKLGDAETVRKGQTEVRDRLVADLKGFSALADETFQARAADRVKPDPARWNPLLDRLKARCRELRLRAANDPELYALGLGGIPDAGMEPVRDTLIDMVVMARNGDDATMIQARDRLEREITKMKDFAAMQTVETSRGRRLVAEMRESILGAPGLAAEARPAARRRFIENALFISRLVSPAEGGIVSDLSSGGAAYFDAIESGDPGVAKQRADLEKLLQALHDALPQ